MLAKILLKEGKIGAESQRVKNGITHLKENENMFTEAQGKNDMGTKRS